MNIYEPRVNVKEKCSATRTHMHSSCFNVKNNTQANVDRMLDPTDAKWCPVFCSIGRKVCEKPRGMVTVLMS